MNEIIIDTSWPLFEASYPGNLGLMELVKYHQVATPEQKAAMDQATANKDWETFKQLIHEVLGIKLV